MTTNNTVSTTEQKPEKEKVGQTFIFSIFAVLFCLTLPYNIGVFIKPDYMPIDGFHVFLFLIYTVVTCGLSVVYFKDYSTQNQQKYGKKKGEFITKISTITQHIFMILVSFTIFYFFTNMSINVELDIQKTHGIFSQFAGYDTFDLLHYTNSELQLLAMCLLLLLCTSQIIRGFFISFALLAMHSIDENVMTLLGHVFNPILECFSHSPLTMTAPIMFVVAITVIHAVMHRKDKAILTDETTIEEQPTEESHAKIIK